jgi:nucleoside-diphosphate-sugar epimerase
MKILIYGSNGWIGSQFVEILKNNNIDFSCGKSRVDDNENLIEEIDKINPTHIISFIGRTHGVIGEKEYTTIDYLEQDGKLIENIRDNLFSPYILTHICKIKNIHFTYLGTGCIFKYDETHPVGEEETGFFEDDEPNFFGSSYSIVKGFTDRIMHLYEDDMLNLRIRMPINNCYHQRNFITKITSYSKICSIANSMTVLPDLLPCVLNMMSDNIRGTINLTNPGLISHNEILEMYKEIVDPLFTWENFSQEDQRKILAADRSNNFLNTNRLENLYPYVLNIRKSVRNCLEIYKTTLNSNLLTKQLKSINFDSEINLLVTGGCGFIGSNFINYYFKKNKINLYFSSFCISLSILSSFAQ